MRHIWIVKIAASAVAMLALTGAFYHGDRLSIDFPADWIITGPNADDLTSATEPGTVVNCNVQTRDVAALASSTLAEINAEYGHVFSVAEWADLLGQKPENLTLEQSDLSPFADAYYHTATFRMKVDATSEATVRYGFYVLPGRVSMAGCYVRSSDYPAYKLRFENVIASFRPW